MNLHEFQGKSILKSFGVAIQEGKVVNKVEEAVATAKELSAETGTEWFVVKAQIHAGGRGKGTVEETGSHGVVLAKGIDKVEETVQGILGGHLTTAQTNGVGKKVNQVLIAEDVYYPGASEPDEFYMSVLLDRDNGRNIIMYSTEGGMDIEKVASDTPDKIIKMKTNPLSKLSLDECSEVSVKLGLNESLHEEFSQTLMGLYEIFTTNDANLIEINPLIITGDNQIMALDGKIDFDDNALYRNESILALRDVAQEDEKERSASEYELNYISLDGTVGCMVNGAGLAMATMDLIEYHGGSPANFLDVGGGTTSERVAKAFEIIQSGENVKAILVNIFGGIVRCDLIANGILQAIEKVGLTLPIVVRLEGTNAKEGLNILNASNFNIITEADLTQAAKQVVEMAK